MLHQRGLSLTGLLLWLVVAIAGALLGMKVVPSVIEYYTILKDAKAAIAQAGPDAMPADVRRAFEKFADIDNLRFRASELEIARDNGRLVATFAYEKNIPLFANVSLVIDYQGSTAGK